MNEFDIRELTVADQVWLGDFFTAHWGSPLMVTSKGVHQCDRLPGFVAFAGADVVGLVTFATEDGQCEIVSLDSLRENQGIGSALLQAVENYAAKQESDRLWLITTNDNLHALGFYQKRGYELVQVYRYAVDEARKSKPQIPERSEDGIPIRDEIELEKRRNR